MRSLGFYYKYNNLMTCPCTTQSCPQKTQKEQSLEDGKDNCIEEVEIHCNLWKVQRPVAWFKLLMNPSYDSLLDIGLLFNPTLKKLVIYLPFSISDDRIEDLGHIIIQDQELCCLIFNEEVETTHSDDCFSKVVFKNDNKALWIYPIAPTNYKCSPSQEKPDGTIMTLSINSKPDIEIQKKLNQRNLKNYIYIRFRIKLTNEDLYKFKREELLSSDIIQSIFSKAEMYDFRINDRREINRKIDEQLKNDGYKPFRMTKVHFFLMCDARNNIERASMKYGSRFLETEKWKDYLGQRIPQTMIAYHWKDQPGKDLVIDSNNKIPLKEDIDLTKYIRWERKNFSNFRLFFMLTYPHRANLQIVFYMLLAIILGAIGSIFSSLIVPFSISTSLNLIFFLILLTAVIALFIIWLVLKNRSSVKFFR